MKKNPVFSEQENKEIYDACTDVYENLLQDVFQKILGMGGIRTPRLGEFIADGLTGKIHKKDTRGKSLYDLITEHRWNKVFKNEAWQFIMKVIYELPTLPNNTSIKKLELYFPSEMIALRPLSKKEHSSLTMACKEIYDYVHRLSWNDESDLGYFISQKLFSSMKESLKQGSRTNIQFHVERNRPKTLFKKPMWLICVYVAYVEQAEILRADQPSFDHSIMVLKKYISREALEKFVEKI